MLLFVCTYPLPPPPHTVIAFDADVISWDLGEQPIRGSRRYHIKVSRNLGWNAAAPYNRFG